MQLYLPRNTRKIQNNKASVSLLFLINRKISDLCFDLTYLLVLIKQNINDNSQLPVNDLKFNDLIDGINIKSGTIGESMYIS